jgi:hypothetical protein
MPFPIQHPKVDVARPTEIVASAVHVNPIANTVLVDSGPLAAGDYEFFVDISKYTSVQQVSGEIQRRNVLNNATLSFVPFFITQTAGHLQVGRTTLAANERVRVFSFLLLATQTVTVELGYRRVG